MRINVLTRCTRPQNLLEIKKSIFVEKFDIQWYILFDTSIIKDIDADLLFNLNSPNIHLKFLKGEPGDMGHKFINLEIDRMSDDEWMYVIDDDNIIHEKFYFTIESNFSSEKEGYVFSQKVGGIDFSGLDIREASPENIKVGSIDFCQFLLKKSLIGKNRLVEGEYTADGRFIESIYNNNIEKFLFIEDIICYYNKLQSVKIPISLPRVLVLGETNITLNSEQPVTYESSDINTICRESDENIIGDIQKFNPDAIVSLGDDYLDFPNMMNQPIDIRSRWLHFKKSDDHIGKAAYQCSMNYILDEKNKNEPLISFFTPFFNTGEKLKRTFNSISSQIYKNWEWVLVNDSSDNGKTLKIAEEISKNDHRVKIYDFREKSNGVIGESKYRAGVLCRGKYIMELDHDDCLTEDAGLLLVKAFKQYPDCKFVYSDCVEVNEDGTSLKYGDGFAFGYGSYRSEFYKNIKYDVSNSCNINPKTIRHIVGVPNHFRAWDRIFYLSIGGHNRRLTIADDYELIVRTFLNTRMVRIPKLCYLQYYHNSNSQNSSRSDIQRRVRTISQYYNQKIHDRFIELGITDWAYKYDPLYPLNAPSQFGIDEGSVNYIMSFDDEKKAEYII